ncbi:MAG: RNA polymerase sigma factor [Cytophagales bacterium]|nr:RNA polymerase sigma factor [Cytophagales bacterium]
MEAQLNPFQNTGYNDVADDQLVRSILDGDKVGLEQLVKKHQAYIFNVALKVLHNVADAEDVTQEIWIKVISNLSKYDPGKAKFRTWLYRVIFNHILNLKKQKSEKLITGFDFFFDFVDQTPGLEIAAEEEQDYHMAVEESKVACMSGMIMCLAREQRLIYVMGEMFEIDHNLAAEMFSITPANFRKKLSRARKDLYQWMHNRCGLVNKNNPCRCPKKTKGFIDRGVVDPVNMKWHSDFKARIHELSVAKVDEVLNERDRVYAELFRDHPFKNYQKAYELLSKILSNKTISRALDLD